MQAKQKQVFESFQRVQDFLGAHPLSEGSSYGSPREMLDAVVAKLGGHTTEQVAGRRLSRASTQRQQALRRALREQHLIPIAAIAKATLSDAPGIEKALKLPAGNLSTTALIAEAQGIRVAIAQFEPVFVRNGRPADFLARLDAQIEELRQSLLGGARNVGRSVGAKQGMQKEIQRGRDAVRMLDAIVRTAFFGDPDVLAKWRIASRVQGVPGGGPATGAEENVAPKPVAA